MLDHLSLKFRDPSDGDMPRVVWLGIKHCLTPSSEDKWPTIPDVSIKVSVCLN